MAKKSRLANDQYLRLYALEGFLLRLAASASSQDFVPKGGVLLAAYQLRRPTAEPARSRRCSSGSPAQDECDPQRYGGQRVGEVVDGVGQQGDRSGDQHHRAGRNRHCRKGVLTGTPTEPA
jgi:hypothetical protein